jgi:hypothetical protein
MHNHTRLQKEEITFWRSEMEIRELERLPCSDMAPRPTGTRALLSCFIATNTITCRMASIHSCISFSDSAANTTVLRTG